jgi:hypothetical protein
MVRQPLRRQMLTISVFFWAGLVLLTALGCQDSRKEKELSGSAAPPSALEEADGETVSLPQAPLTTPYRAQGIILASSELGMVVTGIGAGTEGRSLEALEQQVMSFLSQLQEVYEQERIHDPEVMGNLDVKMTIEPNGTVSDLRFPLKRLSNEKLTAAVYDQMRAWIFPPAEASVDLRYRLLFVPPGMDEVSIAVWEKSLAGRMVVDRNEESSALPLATVTSAAEQSPPVAETRSAKKSASEEEQREPKDVASAKEASTHGSARGVAASSPPIREKKKPPKFVPAWYEITRPSVLYATPNVTAEIISRFSPGKRVWVVNVVNGDWLEVRSVSGRPPGFLPRETARPEPRERASR